MASRPMTSFSQLPGVLGFVFLYLFFIEAQNVNATQATKLSFPKPSGMHGIGTVDLKFTDYSRNDPYANTTIPRSVLLQFFYPAKDVNRYRFSTYMGPATAAFYEETSQIPNGTIALLQPNSHRGAHMKYCGQTQIILFSPGYGTSRLLYTGLAEDLASHGYLVISIDHPYDAPIVEFPDGSLAISGPLPDNYTDEFLTHKYETRVDDVLAILDSLYDNNLTKNIPGVQDQLNISQVAMYGQSLGGATAAGAMLMDKRILGGLNLDGSIFREVQDQGLDKPYMIVAASDLPAIIKLIDRPDIIPPAAVELELGSIDAFRAIDIQRAYILAFFDFVFGNGKDQLLLAPDERYPEITFWN